MQKFFTQLNRFYKLTLEMSRVVFVIGFVLVFVQINGTNAFFTDNAEIKGIEFKTGVWIPTLTIEVDPEEPDGEDGWYSEAPCVKLFLDMDDVAIYYKFEGDENIEGEIGEDVCIYPPEGESHFSAWAVGNENENWVSDVIEADFKVGGEVQFGDVVINELMWMGSFLDSKDEWIELRNMTGKEIDLSNWNIRYGGSGKNGHIEIPHGYSIQPDGYFLIIKEKWNKTEINLSKDLDKDEGYANAASMSLKNDGEKLILENKKGDAIDTVWKDEKWPDGWHGMFLHMSMERDDEPGDGTLASSWHTCLSSKCNDEEYWRDEGLNFGTPGQKNSTQPNWANLDENNFEEEVLEKIFDDCSLLEEIWKNNFSKDNPSRSGESKLEEFQTETENNSSESESKEGEDKASSDVIEELVE